MRDEKKGASNIDTGPQVRLEALIRRMVSILRSFDAGEDYDAWAIASSAADDLEQTASELLDMSKVELCDNCGCRLPFGCGGFFKDTDGTACALNRKSSKECYESTQKALFSSFAQVERKEGEG